MQPAQLAGSMAYQLREARGVGRRSGSVVGQGGHLLTPFLPTAPTIE